MPAGIRGVLAGALALIALQTLVQEGASNRVSGLLGVPGRIAARFIDPRIPAIPDRRQQSGSQDLRRSGTGDTGAPTRRYPDPWIPPQVATPAGAGGE